MALALPTACDVPFTDNIYRQISQTCEEVPYIAEVLQSKVNTLYSPPGTQDAAAGTQDAAAAEGRLRALVAV